MFVRIRGVDKQRVCDAACCQRFIHAVCNGADVGIQRLCSVYGLAAVFARKFCGDRGVREVFTGLAAYGRPFAVRLLFPRINYRSRTSGGVLDGIDGENPGCLADGFGLFDGTCSKTGYRENQGEFSFVLGAESCP